MNFLKAIRDYGRRQGQQVLRRTVARASSTPRSAAAGEGALHIVAKRRDATLSARAAPADDINPNLQDARGNTALIIAVEQNWGEGVGILIKYRANVNSPILAARRR